MPVFKSKYRELKFYVDGELHAFSSGSFSTTDAKIIAVLDKLTDVNSVAEPKTEEVAPKPKAPAKKKASGK